MLAEAWASASPLIATTVAAPVFTPSPIGAEGCTPVFTGAVHSALTPVLISAVTMSLLVSRVTPSVCCLSFSDEIRAIRVL